jgi:hypothetical protein
VPTSLTERVLASQLTPDITPCTLLLLLAFRSKHNLLKPFQEKFAAICLTLHMFLGLRLASAATAAALVLAMFRRAGRPGPVWQLGPLCRRGSPRAIMADFEWGTGNCQSWRRLQRDCGGFDRFCCLTL